MNLKKITLVKSLIIVVFVGAVLVSWVVFFSTHAIYDAILHTDITYIGITQTEGVLFTASSIAGSSAQPLIQPAYEPILPPSPTPVPTPTSLSPQELDYLTKNGLTRLSLTIDTHDVGPHQQFTAVFGFSWMPAVPSGYILTMYLSDKCGKDSGVEPFIIQGITSGQTKWTSTKSGLYDKEAKFCARLWKDYTNNVAASDPVVISKPPPDPRVSLSAGFIPQGNDPNHILSFRWESGLVGTVYVFRSEVCGTYRDGNNTDLIGTKTGGSYWVPVADMPSHSKLCGQVWIDFEKGIAASAPLVVEMPGYAHEHW